MAVEIDRPNVVAPPPLIFLGGLIFGVLLSRFFTQAILPQTISVVVGIIFIIGGLAIILTAIKQMKRAQTNVEPWKPTTAILDTGVYAVSRNPIYLAMISVYAGIAFLFNSLWILPPLVLILLIIHYGVILREEKYLERKFGAAYLDYKGRVRRWI